MTELQDSINKNKKLQHCDLCNDTGKVFIAKSGGWVECPQCHGLTHVVKVLAKEADVPIVDYLRIPEAFKGARYIQDNALVESLKLTYTDASVDSIFSLLKRIYVGVTEKSPQKGMYYIWCNNAINVTKFVYACQQVAVNSGYTCSPYVSLNVLTSIISGDAARYKKDNDSGYASELDYITSDICFLDATAMTSEYGWSSLADIMAERYRGGKSLYVFGYWNSNGVKKSGARFLLDCLQNMSDLTLSTVELHRDSNKKNTSYRVNNKPVSIVDNNSIF